VKVNFRMFGRIKPQLCGGYQKESWRWLPKGQTVRCNQWRKFDRFLAIKTRSAYVKRNHFGKKRNRRFWEITTDPKTMPENSTWYVMTEMTA